MSTSYGQQLAKKWLGRTYTITQTPGRAHPSTRKFYSYHRGWDFATPPGTPIKSSVEGKVVFAGYDRSGWGNRIGIYEPSTGKTTYLSHLSKINVKPNQIIKAGDILGYTGGVPGTYGAGNTTGAHLDITEYFGGKPYVPNYASSVPSTRPLASNMAVAKTAKPSLSYSEMLKNFISKLKPNQRVVAYGDVNKLNELLKAGRIKGKLYKLS